MDLNIIIDDEDEQNSDIEDYTNDVIKKFIIFNRDALEELSDILKVISDRHSKNTGRNNSLFVNGLRISNLIMFIKHLLRQEDVYDLTHSLHYIYNIYKFLTKKLDLMIQDLRIEIMDDEVEELDSIKERLAPRIEIMDDEVEELDSIKERLAPRIDILIKELQNKYLNDNINIDYFIYLNLNNPMVQASVNNIKPTPGTFKLYQVLDTPKIDELSTKFKYSFVDSTSHFAIERFNRVPRELHGGRYDTFDPYGQMEHFQYAREHHLGSTYSTDPEFKKYTGWTKKALRQALTEAGVFDSTAEPVEGGYLHKFPRLSQLGIPQPPVIRSIKPNAIINIIPRYALEVLYAKSQNTTVNWPEVLQMKPPLDLLRKLFKEELHLDVSDIPDDEILIRVESLARNQELSGELPELSQQLIMQPGTPTHPGIMYTKMAYQPEKFGNFKRPRVDIERYLSEIKDICADSNKSSYNAYQLAVDIGLQNYVRANEGKERICQVLDNYLRVIREERIY